MSDLHFSPRPNRAAEIRWRQWGDDAFAEAVAENKPILLAISAVWCHWCHVMDETTYSDSKIIEMLNERYVPIRVDNDRRPDVNARYNMGGWPTTAVLTADGEVLKGWTYVPPDAMQSFLTQIDQFYSSPDNRLELAKQISEIKRKRTSPSTAAAGVLDGSIGDRVFEELSVHFDDEYGGFGEAPKFPQTNALHFLLDRCARSKDRRAATMVVRTLRAMAGGGMYDHVWGGFFRYATMRDFSVPHFEKMLEDLGGLLLACARAAALFDDRDLAAVAVDVKHYLDAHLWNEEYGAYGGSQDADEEFYSLDEAERAQRVAPYVDPTIYTAWNAEAARALILGGPLLSRVSRVSVDEAEWVGRGLRVLETLWTKLSSDGLMSRYYDGTVHIRGLLVDQAWTAWAFVAAHSASGERKWMVRMRTLIEATEVLFDPQSDGYLDRMPGSEPGRVGDPTVPFDENALMARVLFAYATLSGEQRFAARARAMLSRYAAAYRPYRTFAAGYASAVLDAVSPPLDVKIVGPAKDAATRALQFEVLRRAAPPLRIDALDPVTDAARLGDLGYSSESVPVVFLCRDGACFARATSAAELDAALARAGAVDFSRPKATQP